MYNADKTSRMIDDFIENTKDIPPRTFEELKAKVMAELKEKAEAEDNIYDPEHEAEIERRLSALDELSRKEFYRLRTNRKNDGVLSAKELDLLTLKAMEKSFAYGKKQIDKEDKPLRP